MKPIKIVFYMEDAETGEPVGDKFQTEIFAGEESKAISLENVAFDKMANLREFLEKEDMGVLRKELEKGDVDGMFQSAGDIMGRHMRKAAREWAKAKLTEHVDAT